MDEPVRLPGGALGTYTYSENRSARSMSEVLKDIVENIQEMVRSEIRLARAELREETSRAAGAAKIIAIGAGLALAAAACLLVTVVSLLALVMPLWAASLIVGAVLGIAGWSAISKGSAQFKIPLPNRTMENVKENVEWIKDQSRS